MPRIFKGLLTTGFLILVLGAVAGEDKSKVEQDAKTAEVRSLLDEIRNKGLYDLRGPKEKEAIEKLQKMGKDSAPFIGEMLADGLRNRQKGWFEVYRPLYLFDGMGEPAKVALPDIIKSLDDEHPTVVARAVSVLGAIGPAAKEASPKLQKLWAKPEQKDRMKQAIADALKKIDPPAAEKLGIQ